MHSVTIRALVALFFVLSFVGFVSAAQPCPTGWTLTAIDHKCVCKKDKHTQDPHKKCTFTVRHDKCFATCPTGDLHDGGKHGHGRPDDHKHEFNKDGSIKNCPKGCQSCPIDDKKHSTHQCVNTDNDLDNCGGCGIRCGGKGVRSASCQKGKCVIHSCRKGFKLSKDGKSCEKRKHRFDKSQNDQPGSDNEE
ncbi:hypothetical protein AMATHDRAFT_49085 [Amanita thiersii Skay4041]|uniref:Protein CPL1-like domain-containing protein n=1 Tax=Amanita thiersii Skay4041 TaxID=703135 RepID=A0A2A9NEF3_9AGAR|nr:hypothetical protein AMATHDRAFT_49085 [Amanita thiersii Skay4041]